MAIDVDAINLKLLQLSFGREQQIEFLSDVRLRLEDGISPIEVFKQIAKAVKKGPVKYLAEQMLKRAARGENLGEGFRGWLPNEAVEVIVAASGSTKMADALKTVEESLKVQGGSIKTMVSAPIYPLVMLIMVSSILATMSLGKDAFFNIAREMVPEVRWPPMPLFSANVSAFLADYGLLVLGGLIAFLIGFIVFLQKYRGPLVLGGATILPDRNTLDVLPGFVLFRLMQASRAIRALALLTGGGMGMRKALLVVERNSPPYISRHMRAARARLEAGESELADMLNTGLLDEDMLTRLSVLGGRSDPSIALGKMVATLDMKIERTAKVTGKSLQIAAFVAVAGMAILLVAGLFGMQAVLGQAAN